LPADIFSMHCIGELIDPMAKCFEFRQSFSRLWRARATAAIIVFSR
jgi:hypothetical protein